MILAITVTKFISFSHTAVSTCVCISIRLRDSFALFGRRRTRQNCIALKICDFSPVTGSAISSSKHIYSTVCSATGFAPEPEYSVHESIILKSSEGSICCLAVRILRISADVIIYTLLYLFVSLIERILSRALFFAISLLNCTSFFACIPMNPIGTIMADIHRIFWIYP